MKIDIALLILASARQLVEDSEQASRALRVFEAALGVARKAYRRRLRRMPYRLFRGERRR